MSERIRIKLFSNRLVAGIMSRELFNSFEKYDWLNPSVPEEGKLVKMARQLGYRGAVRTWRDGGGDPHTIEVAL